MTREMRARLLAASELTEQERVDLIAAANEEGATFEEIARVLLVGIGG